MITEDYVSFETAKLLKEKGFDEATLCDYSDKGSRWFNDVLVQHNSRGGIACPTLQMVTRWLREVQGLNVYARAVWEDVEIQYGNWEEAVVGYDWFIENLSDNSYSKRNTEEPFRIYEEACEAAIKYCLEKLI